MKLLYAVTVILTLFCFSNIYIHYPFWVALTGAIALMVCLAIVAEKRNFTLFKKK